MRKPQQKPWVKLQLRCIVSNYNDQDQTQLVVPYTPRAEAASLAARGRLLRWSPGDLLLHSWLTTGPAQRFWVSL